jgi:undecaprenyl-diphosphatase
VSSTGHLVLLGHGLGHEDDAAKSLSIVIQLGAVVAVIVYFRKLLGDLARGILRREPDKLRLVLALGIAFLPAALIGFFFHGIIKDRLFGPVPVAIALVAGGVLMIGTELALKDKVVHDEGVQSVTLKQALAVGAAQCLSLWPGMSRSMTTIVGGQIAGLKTATAAEFSFLLSIPVLGAATVFDLVKSRDVLLAAPGGGATLGAGLAAAFVVSLLVIAAFLRYLKRFGLVPFGIYRVLIGALVLYVAA